MAKNLSEPIYDADDLVGYYVEWYDHAGEAKWEGISNIVNKYIIGWEDGMLIKSIGWKVYEDDKIFIMASDINGGANDDEVLVSNKTVIYKKAIKRKVKLQNIK